MAGTDDRTQEKTPDAGTRGKARLRTFALGLLRILILLLAGFLTVLYFVQDWMIFPGASTQGRREAKVLPRGGMELIHLRTTVGEPIAAVFGPALQPDGRPHPDPASRPTILYFYGNAMCLAYSESECERFRRLGLNVIIPDYLGYGLSGGKASEEGCRRTGEACLS